VRRLFAGRGRFADVETPLVVDPGNEACVHAVHRIARGAEELALPLVLVGPPDSGKSRLLAEAGNLVARRGGSVVGGTVRELTTRLRDALKSRSIEVLRNLMDDADLLVVDEVHRLASAPATRSFVFARIETRVQRRKPTIVASRHAPKDTRGLDARGASILMGGLLLHVARPGTAARRRYLTHVSKGACSPALAERLCQATGGGLGALRRAWLASGAGQAPEVRPRRDAAVLLTAVAREFDVKVEDLAGRVKYPSAVRARAAFVELAPRFGILVPEVRAALDHRAALAIRRIHARTAAAARQDPDFNERVERIAAALAREGSS
jgi:chromosomal replication initiation ATPase DnaA